MGRRCMSLPKTLQYITEHLWRPRRQTAPLYLTSKMEKGTVTSFRGKNWYSWYHYGAEGRVREEHRMVKAHTIGYNVSTTAPQQPLAP